MATYVIGDVQGCFTELNMLLHVIKFNKEQDKLWFVGDLVNRGPYSLKVLQFVKSLGNSQVTVLGNHDMHLLAVAAGFQVIRPQDTFQDVLEAEDRNELLNWLRHQKLLHYDPDLKFVMVHAGIYPRWTFDQAQDAAYEIEMLLQADHFKDILANMYGNEPSIWNDDLQEINRYRFIINAFTRMRYCTMDGHLNFSEKGTPEKQSAAFCPWFNCPRVDKLPADVVFGHWALLNGKTGNDHVFATDTGCSWGYALTALRLDDRKYFQVASRQQSESE